MSLTEGTDGDAFEKFVNHNIFRNHQSDAFGADNELLDFVCIGGSNDCGIDGIGIKLNGRFISSKQHAIDLSSTADRVTVEFIFIQSKYKPKFDSGEFNKFSSGVRDFLSEDSSFPQNPKLVAVHELKTYLLGKEFTGMWANNPSVRLYYVALGRWEEYIHCIGYADQFKSDLKKDPTFESCEVHFIDADRLKSVCDNNENKFTASFETIESMPMTDVDGVQKSCIALCYASEFVGMLKTDEGLIRGTLFNDNVRDFQGYNKVNEEILATIKDAPGIFGLLNNGITIVCPEFKQINRRIELTNPQIVNGCQTSSVLFYASGSGIDVTRVPLHVKIIETNKKEMVNEIIRGTNRQNIVPDEAFETTRVFHKRLEEFFDALRPTYGRVFYERRSRQYQDDPKIKQMEKINLCILSRFYVSIFLGYPHMSHRHEGKLIDMYREQIYLDHHSLYPYFTAALLFSKTEKLYKDKYKYSPHSPLRAFRGHILLAFREIVAGKPPTQSEGKAAKAFCEKILDAISDEEVFESHISKSLKAFNAARQEWIGPMKRSSDGIRDVPDFTNVLLAKCTTNCHAASIGTTTAAHVPQEIRYVGRVINVFYDKYRTSAGFIGRVGNDIFFHSSDSQGLDFSGLIGKLVSYEIVKQPNGRDKAIQVQLVD